VSCDVAPEPHRERIGALVRYLFHLLATTDTTFVYDTFRTANRVFVTLHFAEAEVFGASSLRAPDSFANRT
jgi:hypothetical protein